LYFKLPQMKNNSSNGNKSCCKVNGILEQITSQTIKKIAKTSGYIQRRSFAIHPASFIIGFMKMVSKQRNTYADWATEIGLLEGRTISKQSMFERMKPQTKDFVKTVLENVFNKKVSVNQGKKSNGILKHFKNIFVDDSTTISLPDVLRNEFPGNVSKGIKKAQAKIHAMHNVTRNCFAFLHVHSFSQNDQKLSPNVLPFLEKGDLCLRDLGFTTLNVITEFIQRSIYFVSRKSYTFKVYDVKTKEEINLLKELRKHKFIDKQIIAGKNAKLTLRLIAMPVPPEVAEMRKRKARKDRDRRLNHSNDYYELLGYSLYITNIRMDQCSADEIHQLYKLRWKIEIIFKSWKSCFSIEKLIHSQCKNPIRVKCIIYLMLLYIFLFQTVWWSQIEEFCVTESEQSRFSIMKLSNFFKNHFCQIISTKTDLLIKQINAHCRYDKRKDRINAMQLQLKLAF